ncbi:MAG: hypothetical protein QW255_04450 [Candidatus Bilamarchaeaceae archaeon]
MRRDKIFSEFEGMEHGLAPSSSESALGDQEFDLGVPSESDTLEETGEVDFDIGSFTSEEEDVLESSRVFSKTMYDTFSDLNHISIGKIVKNFFSSKTVKRGSN